MALPGPNYPDALSYSQARRYQLDLRYVLVRLKKEGVEVPQEVVAAISVKFMFGLYTIEETEQKFREAATMSIALNELVA